MKGAAKMALAGLLRKTRASRVADRMGPPAPKSEPLAEEAEEAEGEPCPHCAEPCVHCDECSKSCCPAASSCPHCGAEMSAPEDDESEIDEEAPDDMEM